MGFMSPLLLLLTLSPVLVPAGMDSSDPSLVLNWLGSVSFLLCISCPLSPKRWTDALGCLVLSNLTVCVKRSCASASTRSLGVGWIAEVPGRLLTSGSHYADLKGADIRFMSCCLSCCSPAACCSPEVPLSDLGVRKPHVQFTVPGERSPPDPTGTGKQSGCVLQTAPASQSAGRNQRHL